MVSQKSQTGCSVEFKWQTTPFKHLVTGKKQPGGPGRSGEAGKSGRKLQEVAAVEGGPALKKPKGPPRRGHGCRKGRGKGRSK